jgi:hypothetical protein
MSKYSQKEIAEFAKMGYYIDENGNLTKEVKLQKIIRTNADTVTMKSLELKTFEMPSRKTSESRVQTQRTVGNTFTRVQDWFMDEERLAKGLVTMRKPGVDYSLLPDGTKVCRCCQDRFTAADHFYTSTTQKDGFRNICKQCNNRQSKSYLEDKSADLKYKIKNQGK